MNCMIVIPFLLLKAPWIMLLVTSGKTKSDIPTMDETYERLTKKLKPILTETSSEPSPYWIGVAGGPGTGKSTVANEVCNRLNKISPDSVIVIPMDGWHIYQDRLVEEFGMEEGMQRRGAPWTFDFELLYKQLTEAKKEGKASLPMYSREISDPVPDKVLLETHHKIVFVEGIYMLWKDDEKNEWGRLFDLWDEAWFVECPSREDQIERLVGRSLKTWTDKKAKLWGEGRAGASARIECNDLKNADMVRHCNQFADEVIVTH
jgi:pantothenate kinase